MELNPLPKGYSISVVVSSTICLIFLTLGLVYRDWFFMASAYIFGQINLYRVVLYKGEDGNRG